jgi:hypothetical protein
LLFLKMRYVSIEIKPFPHASSLYRTLAHASSEYAATTHYFIVVNGSERGHFTTRSAAKESACNSGYRPVHVARQRHLQDRSQPAH